MYSKVYNMNEMDVREKWQELIESKRFDELSDEQLMFVLANGGETQFKLEQLALQNVKELYVIPEPRSLNLSEKKGIIIPLYQAILAVAAAVVLSFFAFRMNDTIVVNTPMSMASADTVYIEKERIDTVLQTETKIVTHYVIVPSDCPTAKVQSTHSSLSNSQAPFNPDLNNLSLANKGRPASMDKTLGLVENWQGQADF